MHVIDETGNRYGKLVVLARANSPRGHQKAAHWTCCCDCGTLTSVCGTSLRNGNTRSCGCLRVEVRLLPDGEAAFNSLFESYKLGAKKRGLDWQLTAPQFRDLITKSCYYCNMEPSQIYHKSGGNSSFTYNGVDRVDPSVGYIKDNVVSCCSKCNFAKRQMSKKEFATWVMKIYDHWACSLKEN